MLLPKDPFSKIQTEMQRMLDPLGLSETALDLVKRASEFDALAGLPHHLRQVIEGKGPYAAHLELIGNATRALGMPPAMPDAMRRLIEGPSLYIGYLNTLRNAITAPGQFTAPTTLGALAGAQPPYFKQMEALRRATEAAGIAPLQEALSRTFGASNAFTEHLDSVRATAAAFARVPVIEDALANATRGMPAWLKPASSSDMLLPSWQLAAGVGAVGAVRQGLIHDVLSSLHRDRPNTFAFNVAVTLAESFDEADEVGAGHTADLLQKYTGALIALYAATTDWIARQGILNLLMLMLILAFGAYYESHLSRVNGDEQVVLARAAASPEPMPVQQEIARHLQALENTIRDQATAHQTERNIRAVIRPAPLRLAPDAKASTIRVVYPDDRVRVQDIKGTWALVEVFEYKSEATVTGWISRRVLRVPSNGN